MSNTMLETRQKNIERNAKFMESLGLTKPTITEQTQSSDSSSSLVQGQQESNAAPSSIDYSQRDDLLKKFSFRHKYIDFIYRYLDMEILPSPPLLLSGSQGCGKFSIPLNILQQQKHYHQIVSQMKQITCIFSCKGYIDDKHFFIELWSQIILSIQQQLNSSSLPSLSAILNDMHKMRPPKSFTDFTNSLAPILRDLNEECLTDNFDINTNTTSSDNSNNKKRTTDDSQNSLKIYFLFRYIDRLDYLEKSLTSKLLHLSQLCYPGIRVMATTSITSSYSASFVHQNCLLLHFTPYTSTQINTILKLRIRQRFNIPTNNNNNMHNTISNNNNSNNNSNNSSTTHNNTNIINSATTIIESDRYDQFNAFLDQSLESFLVYTTHISLLHEMIHSAWIIYRSKWRNSNSNHSHRNNNNPNKKNNKNSKSSSSSSSVVVVTTNHQSTNTKQPVVISKTLCSESVRQVLSVGSGMRFYTIDDDIISSSSSSSSSSSASFSGTSGSTNTASRSSKMNGMENDSAVTNNSITNGIIDNDNNSANNSNNSASNTNGNNNNNNSYNSNNVVIKFGKRRECPPDALLNFTTATTTTATTGPSGSSGESSSSSSFEPTAMRWLSSMPLSTKYLILAAFIAGSNNKQSDAHIFGVSTRGKRKKTRKENQVNNKKLQKKKHHSNTNNNDENDDEEEDDGNSHSTTSTSKKFNTSLSSSSSSSCYTTLRTFTLERIFGIFGQIACFCGVKNLNDGERASLSLGNTYSKNDDNYSIQTEVSEISRQYGTAQLFSVVKSLTNQKLLFIASSSDNLRDPCYQCNVPQTAAEMIAKSVRFPLRDFIHEDD